MAHETTSAEMERYLANTSIRTSVDLNWGPLVVRLRREPAAMPYICIPGTRDPWLVITTGGASRTIEVRDGRSWRSATSGPGDLAVTSPHRNTEVRWETTDGSLIETIHVCVSADLVYKFAREVAECDIKRVELIDGFAQNDPLVEQLATALARELEFPQTSSRLFADSAAHLLAAHLLRQYSAFPIHDKYPRQALTSRKLRQVRDYVDTHLSGRLTLDDLAGAVHMSAFHFARLFKLSTGETPHTFVTRLRMERAKLLLQNRDSSVANIARGVGFSSKGHFAGAFRRCVGVSPAVFRAISRGA
ncbi:MAG: helix-turn-helix transcriptional regulator [Acidobacteriaceae bacterium]|nr:helix-turn-helix transcriptional regulator [Acidobacteriaceae bacterium]